MARALCDMKAGAAINGFLINNHIFADDIATTAESEKDLQQLVDGIVSESARMGMSVNVEKTEVQHIGPHKRDVGISIENRTLKQVEEFVYLGGTISEDASTDQDTKRRIGLACGVMQNLNAIWKAKAITRKSKVKVYESLVCSVLLYNSETWTLKEATKKKLQVFEMGCLRKIKGVTRRDKIRNVDIRKELGITTDIVQKIQARRLRY